MLIFRCTRHCLYEIRTSFLTELISEKMEASGGDLIPNQGIYTCLYMHMEL